MFKSQQIFQKSNEFVHFRASIHPLETYGSPQFQAFFSLFPLARTGTYLGASRPSAAT